MPDKTGVVLFQFSELKVGDTVRLVTEHCGYTLRIVDSQVLSGVIQYDVEEDDRRSSMLVQGQQVILVGSRQHRELGHQLQQQFTEGWRLVLVIDPDTGAQWSIRVQHLSINGEQIF